MARMQELFDCRGDWPVLEAHKPAKMRFLSLALPARLPVLVTVADAVSVTSKARIREV